MDTPFIFSTATSLNDLREQAIAEENEQLEEELDKNVDSTFAYAVEGTPLAFSRAESLSDLEDIELGNEGHKLSAIPESRNENGINEPASEVRDKSKAIVSKDTTKRVAYRGSEESNG